MGKVIAFVYGVACYVFFLVTFLYAAAFVGNLGVPRTLDGVPHSSLGWALAVDMALMMIFGLQHSVMARQGFKRVWTKIVPEVVERSTYVLFANIALCIMFLFWEPIGGTVWSVENTAARGVLYGLFACGWLTVVGTTFFINHFDLFGVRQVWLNLLGKPYTQLGFVTPGPYRYVRHPLYVGFFMAFWFTPTMTISHLVFAIGTTLYILVAIQFEERDLVHMHGQSYVNYRARTPMLVPNLAQNRQSDEVPASEG